jgi:chemotaxis protein MotB
MVATHRRWWARWPLALALAVAGPSAGCSLVPKSRLDECHQLSRNLQATNAQLKDTVLGLRSQNQDLAQRAVDDARRLRMRDEEVERLTESVHAYQKEREEMAAAVERMRRQFEAAGSPPSTVADGSTRP